MMNAYEIRKLIRKSGLYQYEVAYELGVNEATFIRWLRKPLAPLRVEKILHAIEKLSNCSGGSDND